MLPASETTALFPCTYQQERIWVLEQLHPQHPAHRLVSAIRLQGPLDVERLRTGWLALQQRQTLLNASLSPTPHGVRQTLRPLHAIELPSLDLTALPAAAQAEQMADALTTAAQAPFDLAQGGLMRATLVRLSPTEHVCQVVWHRFIADERSIEIFWRELAAQYAVLGIQPLPQQYTDFARTQRSPATEAAWQAPLADWQRQLAGVPPLLELPTDHPRPATQTLRRAAHPFTITAALTTALQQLSHATQTTLFATLLAAFQVLIYRYTQQTDFVVGTEVANRLEPALDDLIGPFADVLPLRAEVAGDSTFSTLVQRVHATCQMAGAQPALPFERLLQQLNVPRTLSHHPLFQVSFKLGAAPAKPPALSALRLEPLTPTPVALEMDLALEIEPTAEGLQGALAYNPDLFDAATMARWVAQWHMVLTEVAAVPEQRLSALPALTPAEQAQLAAWQGAARPYADTTLPELFAAQVARTPEAIAVREWGVAPLTYRDLDTRANQLAQYLRTLGVGPETLVGVSLERTPQVIIALLAILKAGAAYVPLDPTYPAERLGFMLADAQPKALLTSTAIAPRLPATSATVVCLDALGLSGVDAAPLPTLRATPDNLAYVLFTSGSTGRPKGVAIAHRSAVAMLAWAHATFAPEHLQQVLFATSLNFDLSVYELFVPLTCGGSVVVVENALELLEKQLEGLTLINTVPSAMQELVRANRVPTSVQVVNLAGEPLKASLVQSLYALSHIQQVYNLYGPTEDTTYSTFALCARNAEPPPIGRPLDNSQAYVLDAHLKPVPLGAVGEVYLGGAGLARGYLYRAALTAERFIPHPFDSNTRLYKTGDLARWRTDGQLDFLGRRDHQIKLRGYRIELGEIEAALLSHPALREAVVLARTENAEQPYLAAYVVAQSNPAPTANELRAFLSERLAPYMLPTAWVFLPALPLTPNGKIDRRALPPPQLEPTSTQSQWVAPRTPMERLVAEIWREILRLPAVSVHDHFFELGGHSLLATQVLARLRQALQTELPFRWLFEFPTLAALAEHLTLQAAAQASAPPTLTPQPWPAQIPLSFAQQRLWFLVQLIQQPAYNEPLALRLKGRLNQPALERSLNEIVRRHAALRTTFHAAGAQAVQVIAPTLTIPLQLLDLVPLPAAVRLARAQQQLQATIQAPFDLTTGPLLRAVLVRLTETEYLLCVVMHHLVMDGWSIEVFWRELASLYAAFVAGHPAPLPELALQYVDYTLWQRQWLTEATLETQLAYWQTQLADVPTALELPTDRPRPTLQTFVGATYEFHLSAELTTALRALAQPTDATLFMVLLAAFQVLVYRLTGQDDFVIGSPIASRPNAALEPLIGFFVNTLALCAELAPALPFTTLLREVRETCLGAYAHQDLPFERLVESLHLPHDLSRSALVQVMFAVERAPTAFPTWPGLTAIPAFFYGLTAKFDLTLTWRESPTHLTGVLEYNTDLFEPATIARWAKHLQTLLTSIVADPTQTVAALPVFTPAERQQVLETWNATAQDNGLDRCVQTLFEAQAARTPAALAVACAEQTLTYHALNARANQLAHHLRTLGVGPEVLVGLCVERSLELVVGALGILKAGGAYLPLDPQYPPERVAFMLADADVQLVLTQKHLQNNLAEWRGQALCLDTDWPRVATHSADNLPQQHLSQHLAYAIYTSGSTGRPKGVLLAHAGLTNLVAWHQQTYQVTPTARGTQLASPAFDASVWELWPYLTAGASVHMVPAEVRLHPAHLVNWLAQQRITHCFMPTPLAEAVLIESWPAATTLQALLTGGDRLERRPPATAPFALHNHYGPTESTVVATCTPVAHDSKNATPAIGCPIANTQVYVLDRQMQPVAVGVTGELYIGGEGLARGYLGQPALTAERFVPNPFASTANTHGARLYKTGDLARWRADSTPLGTLEFLGRIDHQVKVRGYRIELGEIEAVLKQHPLVHEAVVLARADAFGDKQLVAYVAGAATAAPTLRAHLSAQLPEYMLPAAFVFLDALPITPNGKVERKALPPPDWTQQHADAAFVAPRTPTETALANIWAEVLQLERVSVYANFFEMGGHSLLATQLTTRIQHTLGVALPLREVFKNPTLLAQAELLAAQAQPTTPQALITAELEDGEI